MFDGKMRGYQFGTTGGLVAIVCSLFSVEGESAAGSNNGGGRMTQNGAHNHIAMTSNGDAVLCEPCISSDDCTAMICFIAQDNEWFH